MAQKVNKVLNVSETILCKIRVKINDPEVLCFLNVRRGDEGWSVLSF